MIKSNALVEKLQVWGFEDGKLIFKDFSLGQVLLVTQPDISTATDEFLNALHLSICDFLNGLPSGLSVQFVQVVEGDIGSVISKHESTLLPEAPMLVRPLSSNPAN